MGGPGVILSRETLLRAAPYFPYCAWHRYSRHEDVEVGRCISRFANTTCTLALEVHANSQNNCFGVHSVQHNDMLSTTGSKYCKSVLILTDKLDDSISVDGLTI
jgi:Chondroitin N-acetylgalactosaminyltransferase